MNKYSSVLTDVLPDSVEIDGIRIPIDTDYRTGMLFDMLAKDESLDDAARMQLGIWLYCGNDLPAEVDRNKLFTAILFFYRGEDSGEKSADIPHTAPGKHAPAGGVFDFVWDGDQIYAAFLQVYRIDLTAVRLHWWKFLALLTALPPDCAFMRTTALRCMDLSEIRDEELRRKLRRAKANVRIRHVRKSNTETEGASWQTDR